MSKKDYQKEYQIEDNKEIKEKPIEKKPEQETKKDIPRHDFYRG